MRLNRLDPQAALPMGDIVKVRSERIVNPHAKKRIGRRRLETDSDNS